MYTYARGCPKIAKKQFSRVPSRGLQWDNKRYNIKSSINFVNKKQRIVHRQEVPNINRPFITRLLYGVTWWIFMKILLLIAKIHPSHRCDMKTRIKQ